MDAIHCLASSAPCSLRNVDLSHLCPQTTEVWEEDKSDGLKTTERCVREIVDRLDGTPPSFPLSLNGSTGQHWTAAEGVHACEILLGVRASHVKGGVFVPLPLRGDDHAVAVRWA
jgi:hypothetical protein